MTNPGTNCADFEGKSSSKVKQSFSILWLLCCNIYIRSIAVDCNYTSCLFFCWYCTSGDGATKSWTSIGCRVQMDQSMKPSQSFLHTAHFQKCAWRHTTARLLCFRFREMPHLKQSVYMHFLKLKHFKWLENELLQPGYFFKRQNEREKGYKIREKRLNGKDRWRQEKERSRDTCSFY